MNTPDPTLLALDRIEVALARLGAATARAKEARLAAASQTVDLEVSHEKLREAVGEAVNQLDTLIARVEQDQAENKA